MGTGRGHAGCQVGTQGRTGDVPALGTQWVTTGDMLGEMGTHGWTGDTMGDVVGQGPTGDTMGDVVGQGWTGDMMGGTGGHGDGLGTQRCCPHIPMPGGQGG